MANRYFLSEQYPIHGNCVFISHQKDDKDVAKTIANYISRSGLDIYFDEYDSSINRDDPRSVVNAIKNGIRARREANSRYFSASEVLNESQQISDSINEYDIFLSHSSDDNDLIAGLKLILQEDFGFKVYVDWNDPQLNPNRISPETASILRQRMSKCKSLVYAFSENSKESKWMPWELGYFDGIKESMVAVLPIETVNSKSIKGSEYVGLYNVIDFAPSNGGKGIWVNDGSKYVSYKRWLSGEKPYIHK